MSFLPLEKLERMMVDLEQKPGFLSDMLVISLNCTLYYEVRLVAATALESGIETHWNRLPDTDKSFVKAMVISNLHLEPDEGLFCIFANITLNIAQFDGLGNFENLASSLVEWLRDNGENRFYENILLRPRALKVLKLLAKSDLSSIQWEAFKALSTEIFEALMDCLTGYIRTYLEQAQSNDETVKIDEDNLRNAIDCLKILKKLVLCGDDVQAQKFFKTTCENCNLLLESRSNLAKRSDFQKLLELHDKCLMKHLKIFMRYSAADDAIFDCYLQLLSRALLSDRHLFEQTVQELQKYHIFSKIISLFLNSEPSKLIAKALSSLICVKNSGIYDNLEKLFIFILAALESKDESSDGNLMTKLEINLENLSLDEETDYREFVKRKLEKFRNQISEDEFKKILQNVDSKVTTNLCSSFDVDL